MAYIDTAHYADPRAWGRPNPHPRRHLTLEEWASRRGLAITTSTNTARKAAH